MALKTIRVTIEGVTPLLMHRFSDAAQMDATSGNRSSTQGDRGTPREQAEQCLYLHDGKIIMPQPNLFRSIIDAGKFFKSGKTKVTTQKSSLIAAAVSMNEAYYPLEYKEDWTVDTRPVRIPATGGRILRHRPCFNDWKITFELELDDSIISEKLLRDIIDQAGRTIGLCDFRPDCKGPFGKFKITLWKVISDSGKGTNRVAKKLARVR